MKEVYKGKIANVDYYPEKKYMVFTFHGLVNIDEAKIMYSTVLSFMKDNKTRAFINDMRLLKGTFTSLNSWVVDQMKPAVLMGLKYDAIVVNNDIFTSFAIDDLIKKVTMVEIQLFDRFKEAERWIFERLG